MPVELSGDSEFIKLMQQKAKQLTSKSKKKQILLAGAELVRREIELNSPIDNRNVSGEHMKDNIIITDISNNDTVNIGPEKRFFYDKFYEFGTTKQDAKPFVEPSYLKKRKDAISAMADKTRQVINGV